MPVKRVMDVLARDIRRAAFAWAGRAPSRAFMVGLFAVGCGEASGDPPPLHRDAGRCCDGGRVAAHGGDRDARTESGMSFPDAGAGLPSEGGLRPSSESGAEGGRAAVDPACEFDHRITPICVEVADTDLGLIHRDPKARIEVPAEVVFAGKRFSGVEFELHGGYARDVPKKSYRLRFTHERPVYDYFGEGPEPHERIVLHASWIDATWARALLTMNATRKAGGVAPRMGYLVLYVNGEYQGLYLTSERVDENFLERLGVDPEGNLYKAENHNADWSVRENPLAGFEAKLDEEEEEEEEGEDLGELFEALHDVSDALADYDAVVSKRLVRSDWEAWHLVHSYAQNVDTFSKNYYLYHDPRAEPGSPEARFRIIMWDADATWANNWNGKPLAPDSEDWYGTRNVFARRYFVAFDAYIADYLQAYDGALDDYLHPGVLEDKLDVLVEMLSEEAERDLAYWDRETTFAAEVERLRDVFWRRHETMTRVLDELR